MTDPGPPEPSFDSHHFRTVMGQFCTGVTIVATSTPDGRPVGFACQSFAALSLDPPLVVFCPAKTSRTWAQISDTKTFAVSMLAQHQEPVSSAFGRPVDDKFEGLRWSTSPLGNPTIDESLAWVDCTLENVIDGGDHHIAVGRVHTLGEVTDAKPLLFYRGGYLSTEHPRVHQASQLESFLTWDAGAWM
jgi:3-hydroxy-9,10-secoandrosta-1,3,5(10)-triene-9,17-dione monooxygenase reductase component